METLCQDIRFAIRTLRKNAGFTVVAILTLALGIGANTALFSVVDAVLLRPLPYRDSDRLVGISLQDVATKNKNAVISFTKLQRIQSQSQLLEGTAGFYPLSLNLAMHGMPEQINGAHATGNLFAVLGVDLAAGRVFRPQEDEEGGANVAIVTDSFWRRHFGARPEAIGQSIPLDGHSVIVIGILPPSFRFPFLQPEPDVWLPRVFEHFLMGPVRVRTGASYVSTIARMKPGVSISQVASELGAINAAYKRDFPGFADAIKFELASDPLKESLVGPVRTPLLVLLAAVGFVLLIGCANVASLVLARATSRRREIAIRRAIGASHVRLIRQLLTESVLLSLMGGAVGILLAFVATRLLAVLPQGLVPHTNPIVLNMSVLAFTAVLCLITGLAFGLLPSMLSSRQNLNETLYEARGSSTQTRSGGRSQTLLVLAEVAVATLLVIGAGVLIRSFAKLTGVNPGFDAQNLTTFSLKLSETRYAQPAQRAAFFRDLMGEMQAIPGVQSAAAVRYLPLAPGGLFIYFCPEGAVCQGLGKDPFISTQQITPDYFKTMRIPLLRGRFFDEHDVDGSKSVVIINETAARLHFAGRDPIGMHITGTREKIPLEIVGIVADVRSGGLTSATLAEMYQPLEQSPSATMTILVRCHGDPAAVLTATRHKIAELDPDLPMAAVASMRQVIAASGRVSQSRLIAQLTGSFAALALLLTAIGIYGVVTYSVGQRTREMGVRMALGASRGDVRNLVLSRGMRAVLGGIALGFVAAIALTRLIRTLLFGTSATDPLIFAAVLLLLIAIAVLACYVPARRAAELDPLVALRYE
ncbi:MAG: ABC transporter permease [Acidobacteria bacterium]|nr:ABC transporter permease [Acidobacteriota bacterium]